MRFNPGPGEGFDLDVGAQTYAFRCPPHPAAPSFPFAVEGSEATVYQVWSGTPEDRWALKVFKATHRMPELAVIARQLRLFAGVDGLRACGRHCLEKATSPRATARFPELDAAMLIPWLTGPTWSELVRVGRPLHRPVALRIAHQLLECLSRLERIGAAHCDLSGANVIVALPSLDAELIDVEHMFAPGFVPPSVTVVGTPGYNLMTSLEGLWDRESDRFAGAMLACEMLGWSDPEVVSARSPTGTYFDPTEVQARGSPRLHLLVTALRRIEPKLVPLLECAWGARHRRDCRPLSEWADALRPHVDPTAPTARGADDLFHVHHRTEPTPVRVPVVKPPSTHILRQAPPPPVDLAEAAPAVSLVPPARGSRPPLFDVVAWSDGELPGTVAPSMDVAPFWIEPADAPGAGVEVRPS